MPTWVKGAGWRRALAPSSLRAEGTSDCMLASENLRRPMWVKGSGIALTPSSLTALSALSPAPLCAGEKKGKHRIATGRAQAAASR